MKILKKLKLKRIQEVGGFTLLEVMVGLVIFTLGLLLLGSMMIVSIDGNVWSNKTTEVVQLVRDKVEDFRNMDAGEMVNGSDMVAGMTRSWAVTDEAENLKRLTVVVSWNDKRDVTHACTTATFIQVGG
jgi:prepilin-type N-terminal cleavage/methylation domain-containing protein